MPLTSTPDLIAARNRINDTARIRGVVLMGQLVQSGSIIQAAIDPPQFAGGNKALQSLIDCVPAAQVERSAGVQTVRGGLAPMRLCTVALR